MNEQSELDSMSLKILNSLCIKSLDEDVLAERLNISVLKLKVYVDKLEKKELLKKIEYINLYGKLCYKYEVCEENLKLTMNYWENYEDIRKQQELKNYFIDVLSQGFENSMNQLDDTSLYRQQVLKISKEQSINFKIRLNKLLMEFNLEEDLTEDNSYIIMSFIFPNNTQ